MLVFTLAKGGATLDASVSALAYRREKANPRILNGRWSGSIGINQEGVLQ